MIKTHRIVALTILGFVALIVVFSSLFSVHQTEQALVLQWGEPKAVVTEPGLHVKLPWPFQNVLYVDKRVLNVDLSTEEVIAQDKKRLVVDAFARYRITDLGSTNGTVVNGQLITSAILQDGDKIVIGEHLLRFDMLDEIDREFQRQIHRLLVHDESAA